MPNWISDEDAALDSGDAYTCKHCGKFLWVEEVYHTCEAGRKDFERKTKEFNDNYTGNGQRIKKQITVEVECYNTALAIQTLASNISAYYMDGHGSDSILEFNWKVISVKNKEQ